MSKKIIMVKYYALLREEAECEEEDLATAAETIMELFVELKKKHKFSLTIEQLRVAVNGGFVSWEHVITSGDEVVFIPPVAGG